MICVYFCYLLVRVRISSVYFINNICTQHYLNCNQNQFGRRFCLASYHKSMPFLVSDFTVHLHFYLDRTSSQFKVSV